MCVCVHACMLSCFSGTWLSVTLQIIAHKVPLSMGFSTSGLPCPPPGDRPYSGIKPESLLSPALAGGSVTTSATWEARNITYSYINDKCIFFSVRIIIADTNKALSMFQAHVFFFFFFFFFSRRMFNPFCWVGTTVILFKQIGKWGHRVWVISPGSHS